MRNKEINIESEKYHYYFPLLFFSKNKLNLFKDIDKIKKSIKARNIFYSIFNNKRRALLITRILALRPLLKFLISHLKYEFPKIKKGRIISIFVYGSYVYGNLDYQPDDIDMGIIVNGSIFKYLLNKIKIPPSLQKKINAPIKKINIFIYGKDNLTKGVRVNDTVFAGIIHKNAVSREITSAYWRNIVIWGKDFKFIPNNEKNVLAAAASNLKKCYIRLFEYWNKKEDKVKCGRKIATRIIETNLFLKIIYPKLKIQLSILLNLPSEVVNNKLTYVKIKKICDTTLKRYEQIRKMLYDKDKSVKLEIKSM